MGEIHKLLLYYGNGEKIFEKCIADVEADIVGGVVTPLCKLMAHHGSDKGDGGAHNYAMLYDRLVDRILPRAENVFELGVGSTNSSIPCNMGVLGKPGASLRAWRDRLGNASICGADIDRDALFQEHGIQTLYVDQTDPASIASLWAHLPFRFDAIIDDGFHSYEGNSTFFLNSRHVLSEGGIFIIEDIVMSLENISKYDALFNHAGCSGFLWRMPHRRNRYDNGVAVLTFTHDLIY